MNDQYAELYSSYQWFVPSQFNIAQACVHRWAHNTHEGRKIALYVEDDLGQREAWSYTRLAETTNQLANGLIKMGINPGDRVAVLMGQRPEIVAAYMAVLSVNAVVMPLPAALGAGQLAARLRDAQARAAIVDTSAGPDVLQAQLAYPDLSQIIGLGFQHENIIPWRTLLARQPTEFKALVTTSSSPAFLMYNSGSHHPPCGALLAHGALIGNLPGFVSSQNWFPQTSDVFWSPAPWTSHQGLFNALLPCLYFGRPLVATLGHPSGGRALDILQHYQVTNAFLPLEMLVRMQQAAAGHHDLALKALALDTDALDPSLLRYCQSSLQVTPNLVFGVPEANNIVGNSAQKWPAIPDSIGRPYPGHLVSVLDPQGRPCPAGVVGQIAINRYDIQGYADPALFLGYWNNPGATQARYLGDWCLTGVSGSIDKEGYFRRIPGR